MRDIKLKQAKFLIGDNYLKSFLIIMLLLSFISCTSGVPELTKEEKFIKEANLAKRKQFVKMLNDEGNKSGIICNLGFPDDREIVFMIAGRKDNPDEKIESFIKQICNVFSGNKKLYLDADIKTFGFTDMNTRQWTYDLAKETLIKTKG